jgi:hypothetical protein
MRKTLQTILFLCLFVNAQSIFAQLQLGVHVGTNVANVKNSNFLSSDVALFTGGISLEKDLNQRFSLQLEANYVQKGYGNFSADYNYLRTNWLETNLMAKIKLGVDKPISVFLLFGPNWGYALDGKYKASDKTYNIDFINDEYSRYDVGFNFGGQVNYKNLFLDIRYQLGTTDMYKNYKGTRPITEYNRCVGLTLGYRFSFKKKDKSS